MPTAHILPLRSGKNTAKLTLNGFGKEIEEGFMETSRHLEKEMFFSAHDTLSAKELVKRYVRASNASPKWTKAHIEELVNDFFVVPKDLFTEEKHYKPVLQAQWQSKKKDGKAVYECTKCSSEEQNLDNALFCSNCGAAMTEPETKYYNARDAYDWATLSCWYQSSIDENEPPVWTDKHLEELLNTFYLVPTSATPVNRMPVISADWVLHEENSKKEYRCSHCGFAKETPSDALFCSHCGAYMSAISRLQAEGNVSPTLKSVLEKKKAG